MINSMSLNNIENILLEQKRKYQIKNFKWNWNMFYRIFYSLFVVYIYFYNNIFSLFNIFIKNNYNYLK